MLIGAVIPVYNHGGPVGTVVRALRANGLPVLLVDDGSAADCAAVLDALVAADPQVHLQRLPHNQGKGAAVMAGLRAAGKRGWTHALQIDADGQHDTRDVPRFIAAATAAPEAFICGCPVYDASVPKGRLYGRYATHIWVWINTLSLAVRDSMCGFRVYPLASVVALIDDTRLGRRARAQRTHGRALPHRWRLALPRPARQPADLGHAHAAVLRHAVARADAAVAQGGGMKPLAQRVLWSVPRGDGDACGFEPQAHRHAGRLGSGPALGPECPTSCVMGAA